MSFKFVTIYESIDHISSAPSIRFPVEELTKLCRSRGVIVIINGAHSPGHVPLNLMELGADFYVGKGSSWFTYFMCFFVCC